MHSVRRHTAALVLSAVALLAIPALTAAKTPPTIFSSKLSHSTKVTCNKTGITGPTGKVGVVVYALKGKHPAKSALSCTRGIAVVKAGKADLFAKLSSSYGKTVTVKGSKYTLQAFISPGASGPSPVFLGAGTAVIANYASGR
jgi:hypothetical protein